MIGKLMRRVAGKVTRTMGILPIWNLGQQIGEGDLSQVYAMGKDKVVKLAKSKTDLYYIRSEYLISKIVNKEGVALPRPYCLVRYHGRPGYVMDRVHGETLMELLLKPFMSGGEPSHVIKQYDYTPLLVVAKALAKTHSRTVQRLPVQRDRTLHSIQIAKHLSDREKEMAIKILMALPEKSNLCHGDLNPTNFFVKGDQAVLIDWAYASKGNPEADLAELILVLRYSQNDNDVSSSVQASFDSIRQDLIKVFLEEYTKHSTITSEEIEQWMVPIAVRRLSAADYLTEYETNALVDLVRNYKEY